ncbi:MAG: pyridoxamine 5'-phosphate oxidase family protein, partial [Kiloniellales bacterium]|nr:pyridoxamine 5'-phosphate oxidase family protein [Kiloniellales bacterium]
MSDAVTQETSPFHEGERQVQERLGVRDQIEAFARRVVRDHMPDQHRAFHEMLPFLLLGTLDARGRPWASLLAGRPGFVTSPDARTLKLTARPPFGDPLRETLKPGADVGLLGIQLETRRRNRLTGRVEAVGPEGFTIAVRQTFGNCPQYIQSRAVEVLP